MYTAKWYKNHKQLTLKAFYFQSSKLLDYKQCLEKQKHNMSNYSVPYTACWLGGVDGGNHAAHLTTRVAKQQKAKQLHEFCAVPLDFTNQWHSPPNIGVRWSNRIERNCSLHACKMLTKVHVVRGGSSTFKMSFRMTKTWRKKNNEKLLTYDSQSNPKHSN